MHPMERGWSGSYSERARRQEMAWTVFVSLLILWLLGFSFHVAGDFVHLLLALAVAVFLINVFTKHRNPV
jgi:hypothetical protein